MRNLARGVLAVSLMLTGCAKEFPVQQYSEQEVEYMTMLQSSGDPHSRTELARLYFEHNELDKADLLLEKLVAEGQNNPEVLAWHGANRCKIAGKKGPWLLGLDKMVLAKSCLRQIQDALQKDPDNFTIQMIAMHTGAAVNAFDALEMARAEMQKVGSRISKNPHAYTASALFSYHYAAGLVELAANNRDAAKTHFVQASRFPVEQGQKQLLRQQLQQLQQLQ